MDERFFRRGCSSVMLCGDRSKKNRVIRAGQAVQQRNAEQICDDGRKLFRLYVDIPVTVSVFHGGEGMHVIRAEYKDAVGDGGIVFFIDMIYIFSFQENGKFPVGVTVLQTGKCVFASDLFCRRRHGLRP